MNIVWIRIAAIGVAFAAATPALAHVGHVNVVGGHPGLAGFMHPMSSAANILAAAGASG